MSVKKYIKGDSVKLSKNFNSKEFSCKGDNCCSVVKIDNKLVDFAQKIRDNFNAPVTINSGYRCEKHNKKVGGALGSYHTKGMAADIVVKDIEPKEVAKFAESLGIKGIGLYDSFVHIDTREKKSFWYGHGQESRTTFGGVSSNASDVVKEWQSAATKDGFKFASGIDGVWGKECEAVAKKAICKKRLTYKYKNLTKIVQNAVGVSADGKFGKNTKDAVIKFQKLVGVVADGEVGLNTWKKILGVK